MPIKPNRQECGYMYPHQTLKELVKFGVVDGYDAKQHELEEVEDNNGMTAWDLAFTLLSDKSGGSEGLHQKK